MLLNSPEIFGTPRLTVMDPVHGGISFFSHEKLIMDHPLFQRIRHIKQNDILHFVFPGATHSRFEHCIGTMHVAGRIFKGMMRRYLADTQNLELLEKQIDAIQYCYGCLRMAALLHDAGHMPFSHQFEESSAGKRMLSDSTIIKTLWNEESLKYIEKVPDKMSHEHYSIQCAIKILNDVKNKSEFNFEICDVIGMMENAKPKPSNWFCNQALEILKIFSKVPELINSYSTEEIGDKLRNLFKDIISGEIDADKMDYLLRDSYFSGCNYGVYNIDHLVNNICVGFDPNDSPPWVGIALDKKGLGAFEDFVYSRFRMYLQVYNHKTVIGLKWLVREAIAEILKDKNVLQTTQQALSDMPRFTDFTDTYCWEAFRRYTIRNQNSACAYLVNRKILNHIVEIKDQALFEKRTKQIEMEEKKGKPIIYDECSSRFSKITPVFDRIRLLVRDDIPPKRRLESIPRHSSFFSKFTNVTVTHYYEAPEWYQR